MRWTRDVWLANSWSTSTSTAESALAAASEGREANARRQRRGASLLALLAYLAAGMLEFTPTLRDPLHATVSGGESDIAIFLWFLSHTATSLLHEHGQGLLVTHDLNAPVGINAMWNTGLLLPSTLLTPVTALGGPVLSLNLLVLLGPVLSAWSAFLCSARLLHTLPGRLLTGVVFGFSPPMIATSFGHYQLTLLMFVPPLLLLVVDAATGHRSPVRSGLLLGVVAACQVVTGEEVLALTGLTGLVVLGLLGLQRHHLAVARLPALLGAGATALVTMAVLAGYPLAVQFFGPLAMEGPVTPPNTYVLDPLATLVPTSHVLLRSAILERALHPLVINPVEGLGYVGAPVLLLVTAVGWHRRRDLAVRTTALAALVMGILACGYSLHVAGNLTHLIMPWGFTVHMPVLEDILPVRMMLVVDLLVALLLGFAVEAIPVGRRTLGGLLVSAAVATLVPLPGPTAKATGTPAFFRAEGRHLRGTVLLLPIPTPDAHDLAMVWAAEAGTRFALPGGYFLGPRADGRAGFGDVPRPTEELLATFDHGGPAVAVTPTVRAQAAIDLAHWDAHTVVLGPSEHHPEYLAFLTTLLRRPGLRVQGVWIWRDVQAAKLR